MASRQFLSVRSKACFLIDQLLTRFLLQLSVITYGRPQENRGPGKLWVANHVSFLDVMVLFKIKPLFFVTSMDVGRAGAFGLITRASGCIFVDRNNRAQAKEAVEIIRARLKAGFDVILFPEGTSSDGLGLLPFKNALFESVLPDGIVQPILIQYDAKDTGKNYSRDELFFFGEQKLIHHLKSIFSTRKLKAHVRFLETVDTTSCKDRFEVAEKTRQIMLRALSRFPTLVEQTSDGYSSVALESTSASETTPA